MLDRSEVKKMVRHAASLVDRSKKVDREARIACAKATHAAFEANLIGSDGEWENQKAYAAALHVSEGQITGLKRLGQALALGVDPDEIGKTWNLLSSKAGTKEVGDALAKEDATPESIVKAVTDTFGSDGRRKAGGTGQPGTGQGGQGGGTPPPEKPKGIPVTPRDLQAFLTAFTPNLHSMSDADQDKVEAALLKFVAANQKRRRTLAEKAAKAAS
jgi:hypothetical protein